MLVVLQSSTAFRHKVVIRDTIEDTSVFITELGSNCLRRVVADLKCGLSVV